MKGHDECVRSMIEHENSLVNFRLTWLITLQGLLFASLSFLLDKPHLHQFIPVLSWVGQFAAASCWYSLSLTQRAIQKHEEWWNNHCPDNYDGPPVIGLRQSSIWLHLLPWNVLPFAFEVAWIAILLICWTH